jgi:hypothetical protein
MKGGEEIKFRNREGEDQGRRVERGGEDQEDLGEWRWKSSGDEERRRWPSVEERRRGSRRKSRKGRNVVLKRGGKDQVVVNRGGEDQVEVKIHVEGGSRGLEKWRQNQMVL